jgi:FHA domain
MAKLQITTEGFSNRVLSLKLGCNRLGRSAGNDFQIEHPTISSTHCEIYLADGEVRLRDCDSTNGTFLEGEPVNEAILHAGQRLALGDVQMLVESVEVNIAIPQFEVARPAPPVVLTDGGMVCPRHPEARVVYKCKRCREIMCDGCVHRLKRRGGKPLLLCCKCSHPVERMGAMPKKKKSLFQFLQKTVKLPFARSHKD